MGPGPGPATPDACGRTPRAPTDARTPRNRRQHQGDTMTQTDDGLDEVFYTLAARKVRHLLETAVEPRIRYMLQRAVDGHPVPACNHIAALPGDGGEDTSGLAMIDWMCEGTGILCWECAKGHLTDPTTRHRDPRHECCIVCGYASTTNLHPMLTLVDLREQTVVASDKMQRISGLSGQVLAHSFSGRIATTPVVW